MSATESIRFDPRYLISLFEVHYWPTVGRVMAIHVPAGATCDGPIVTDMMINGSDAAPMTIAHVLASAGDGKVYVHTESGLFNESAGMARTPA